MSAHRRDGSEFLYWQVDQTEGEHGFRRDHVNLLRDLAGYWAITVCEQADFRLRRAAQARERTLDEIASLIERFLPKPNDGRAAPSPRLRGEP